MFVKIFATFDNIITLNDTIVNLCQINNNDKKSSSVEQNPSFFT